MSTAIFKRIKGFTSPFEFYLFDKFYRYRNQRITSAVELRLHIYGITDQVNHIYLSHRLSVVTEPLAQIRSLGNIKSIQAVSLYYRPSPENTHTLKKISQSENVMLAGFAHDGLRVIIAVSCDKIFPDPLSRYMWCYSQVYEMMNEKFDIPKPKNTQTGVLGCVGMMSAKGIIDHCESFNAYKI